MMPRRQATRLDDGTMFYVRGEQPPETLLAAVPRVVARVDSNLPVIEPRTFDSQVRRNVRTDWLLVTLSGTLAVVATLLAALGLYGVLSYMVAQRTREIGLRLALGAEPAGVRRMVMKQVGWMAGIGAPIGIGAALLDRQSRRVVPVRLDADGPARRDCRDHPARGGRLRRELLARAQGVARRSRRRAAGRVTGGRVEHL